MAPILPTGRESRDGAWSSDSPDLGSSAARKAPSYHPEGKVEMGNLEALFRSSYSVTSRARTVN
jgi:hypothetical protein